MSGERPYSERILGSGRGAAATRFLVALAVVVALKSDTLFQPPVWDTAMGLFPAAITLARNGFDVVALLRMPGYLEGGPNAHGLSPVTLMTAVVLRATGGGPSGFALLHLIQYSVVAWALLALFRLARPIFGAPTTALLCLVVLLHPIFSAQAGYLYLEVPLFLCAVSALLAWTEGRLWRAALWAGLAYAIKETGIVVAATLVVATALEKRPREEKSARIARIGLPAMVWAVGTVVVQRIAAAGGHLVPRLHQGLGGMGQYLSRFLLNVPDLIVYLGVFLVAAALTGPEMLRTLRGEPTDPATRPPERRESLVMAYSALLIILFVLLFLVALPVVASFTIVLPRYYVLVLPFLLLWMGVAVKRLAGRRMPLAAGVAFVVLGGLFAINTNGALYPSDIDTEGPGNDPPLTERSNAYRRLLALEREAVHAIETLPADAPVYYGHYEHYLLSYPGLGYVSSPRPNGHDLSMESVTPLITGEPLPPCSYALYNYPWLGGANIRQLIDFAESDPDLSSEVVREFRDGRYVITLVAIQRGDAHCSP